MTKNVYDYRLYVKGIFGRNRTIKFQSFELTLDSEMPLTPESILTLAETKLNTIKLKGPYWFKVVEQLCNIEGDFKSFMLFSDKVLKEEKRS